MSFSAIIVMILMLSIVWGGFILALKTAMKHESSKQAQKSQ
ncbi:MAG: methionine/alanine import family NSS transporter small subunit [bacterium]